MSTMESILHQIEYFSKFFFLILRQYSFIIKTLVNLRRLKYTSSFILVFLVSYSSHGQVQNSLSNRSTDELLELYKGGLKFLKKSLTYNRNRERDDLSLASILEISNIYIIIKNTDSVIKYTSMGKEFSLKLKDTMSYHQLLVNEAIVKYMTGDINNAVLKLEKEKFFFEKKGKHRCLIWPYFYLSRAHYLNKDIKTSIAYLKKIDSIFQLEKCVFNSVRVAYELLIEHSENTGSVKDQVFYLKQLVRFDSILNQSQPYLIKQLFEEYNIPLKKSEKKGELETMRQNEKNSFITIFILFILLILVFVIGFFQFNRRKFYQNRALPVRISSTNALANSAVIPDEIVEEVLVKLHVFEQEKQYLEKSITLNSLAKEIHTNTNYLSKIINTNKGSSFSNYLNTLRINYIVHELNTNNKYRKFTIQALAEIAGFNMSESFAKAFYKITKSKPSDYIRKLGESL